MDGYFEKLENNINFPLKNFSLNDWMAKDESDIDTKSRDPNDV